MLSYDQFVFDGFPWRTSGQIYSTKTAAKTDLIKTDILGRRLAHMSIDNPLNHWREM